MTRYQYQTVPGNCPFRIVAGKPETLLKTIRQARIVPDAVHYDMQGIYHGIARHQYPFFRHRLSCQITAAQRSRSEMPRSYPACNLTVHLLRPWTVDVVRSQPGFYMSHRNLLVERSQSRCRGRGSVSMHQYEVWPCLVKHGPHPGQDSGCHVI